MAAVGARQHAPSRFGTYPPHADKNNNLFYFNYLKHLPQVAWLLLNPKAHEGRFQ